MHRWFLVCCIIDNVNVMVICVDLDRAALVCAVWATEKSDLFQCTAEPRGI